jgi:hypothetical protein
MPGAKFQDSEDLQDAARFFGGAADGHLAQPRPILTGEPVTLPRSPVYAGYLPARVADARA